MPQGTRVRIRRSRRRSSRRPAATRRSARPALAGRLSAYWRENLRSLVFSLERLGRAPAASLMTVAVIGIALSLPAGLYVLLTNVETVSRDWQAPVRISVFLKPGVAVEALDELAERVRTRDDVVAVHAIPADVALESIRETSGFLGDALKLLDTNPLPHVLVVNPRLQDTGPGGVQDMTEALSQLPQVDQVQLDMEWLERVHALIEIGRRTVIAVGSLLALAVLFVVGNTVRLDIQSRREEVEVIKLVGATNAFVRRPFLYGGLWYGILGGIVAWIIVVSALSYLDVPVRQLALLYQSDYQLVGFGFRDTLSLLALAATLGWLGSWLAVGRHLRKIEPC